MVGPDGADHRPDHDHCRAYAEIRMPPDHCVLRTPADSDPRTPLRPPTLTAGRSGQCACAVGSGVRVRILRIPMGRPERSIRRHCASWCAVAGAHCAVTGRHCRSVGTSAPGTQRGEGWMRRPCGWPATGARRESGRGLRHGRGPATRPTTAVSDPCSQIRPWWLCPWLPARLAAVGGVASGSGQIRGDGWVCGRGRPQSRPEPTAVADCSPGWDGTCCTTRLIKGRSSWGREGLSDGLVADRGAPSTGASPPAWGGLRETGRSDGARDRFRLCGEH